VHGDLEGSLGELASPTDVLHNLVDPAILAGDRVPPGDVPHDVLCEDLGERSIVATRARLVLSAEEFLVRMQAHTLSAALSRMRRGEEDKGAVITGLHHLSLRVRELAASAQFYEDALRIGVERLGDRCRFLVGDTVLVLREPLPGTPAADRFSEARIGLDHVAFKVETAAELEELSERLRGLGAEVGELEHDPHGGGAALTFRDPDNIQLEFYLPP